MIAHLGFKTMSVVIAELVGTRRSRMSAITNTKSFLKEWYEMWEYNWLQSYVSKWNPMGIIYAYREVKEERKTND